MDSNKQQLDVAVFFDFENIVYSLRNNYGINANFEDLMDKCNEFGRVVVARAFADWNRQSSAMIPALIANGFDPVYVPSFYTNERGKQDLRKNAVDMYMAIDAMDILHNRKNVDTFIMLTGDSDFLPVVTAIRREGNRVIAIGVDGTVSSHLAQAVDEFIFYSQVSSLPDSKMKSRPKDVYDGLVEAIKRLQKENRSTVLPNVKMMMAELLGGFDEKTHTDKNGRRFQKFKEFVQEAERRNLVQLITTGTVNEVFLGEDDIKKRMGIDPERKQEALTLDHAFNLLVTAVDKASEESRSLRTSSIKGIMMEMHNDFDEKQITVDNGDEPFSRFSDFVQAAQDKGLVKLVGESTQLEIHPVEEDDRPEIAAAAKGAESKAGGEKEKKEKEKSGRRGGRAKVKTAEENGAQAVPADAAPTDDAPPAAGQAKDETSESRRLIIDSLKSFKKYPASFLQIEAHCRQVRNERGLYLPSPQVRELLTEATRQLGILKRISPPGVSPAQYELQENEALIAKFLGEGEGSGEEKAEAPKNGRKKKGRTKAKMDEAGKTSAEKVVADAPAEPAELSLVRAYDLLSTAISNSTEKGRSLKLAAIKKQMKQLHPDFNEQKIPMRGKGFKRFSEFVEAAQTAGVVVVKGEGSQAEVHLVD